MDKKLDRMMEIHRWFIAKKIPDYDEIYEVFDELPALVSRVRELEAEVEQLSVDADRMDELVADVGSGDLLKQLEAAIKHRQNLEAQIGYLEKELYRRDKIRGQERSGFLQRISELVDRAVVAEAKLESVCAIHREIVAAQERQRNKGGMQTAPSTLDSVPPSALKLLERDLRHVLYVPIKEEQNS